MTLHDGEREVRGGDRQVDALHIFKGASIILIGRGSGRGLDLVTQVVLARRLGVDAFGVYAIGWTLFRMLAFLGTLGFDQGAIRYGARYWNQDSGRLKGVILQALGSAAAASAALAAALYLLAPSLAAVFDDPRVVGVIRWFTPGLVFYATMRVAAGSTQVSERMQYSAYAQDLGQPAANLILALLFLVVFSWQLAGAVAAAVLSFTVGLGVALFFLVRLLPDLVKRTTRPAFEGRALVHFSLTASMAGVQIAYLVWVDRLILGAFRPPGDVGVYQAASQFSSLFSVILAAVATIATPIFARMYYEGRTEGIQEIYRVTTKWALYLSLPFYIVIVVEPRGLVTMFFGSQYESGWLALVILATGQLVNVGTGAVHSLLVMTGHQKAWLTLSAISLATNVILNLLLIPIWGLEGAAVATAIALTVLFVTGVLLVRVKLAIGPYDRRFLKPLIAGVVAFAALGLKGVVLDLSTVPDVLLTALLAILAFVGTLAVVGIDGEDRALLEAIRSAAGWGRWGSRIR